MSRPAPSIRKPYTVPAIVAPNRARSALSHSSLDSTVRRSSSLGSFGSFCSLSSIGSNGSFGSVANAEEKEEDLRRPFCYDPMVGFDLASPCRPMAILGLCVPLMPTPVPLVKSQSAPAECFFDHDSGKHKAPNWLCKGCGTTDARKLEKNYDSAYACLDCGVVDSQATVAVGRQKFCAREDDKTIVADDWARDPGDEAAAALARGHETAVERRRRLVASGGGSCIPQRVSRGMQIGAAQSRVDTAICRDMRNRLEGDPKKQQKLQRVLRFVEAVFDQLGTALDVRIQKHVRLEASRVLRRGFQHDNVCDKSGCSCQIAISTRANMLIAICTVQCCLERLLSVQVHPSSEAVGYHHQSICSIAPECSSQELSKLLERIKQLQTQGAGASQRTQVAAVVGLLLDWTPEQLCKPCASHDEAAMVAAVPLSSASQVTVPLPSPLMLPAATLTGTGTGAGVGLPLGSSLHTSLLDSSANSPALNNAAGPGSPSDIVWSVRDMITGAARLANVRADVRCAAMAAIMQQELSEWIRTSNTLPVDVLGIAVLTAATIKLQLEDSTNELLEQYCYEYSISPTTARQAAITVASMMTVEPAPGAGVFGDGIF